MNVSNWKKIDWKRANLKLKELQAKLYGALKIGACEREIRAIHNEITRSFSARAIAVRKVTTSKGNKTSGIDKILW
jgi:RNA-directed DNA polymerase